MHDALNDLGAGLKVDGAFGKNTAAALSSRGFEVPQRVHADPVLAALTSKGISWSDISGKGGVADSWNALNSFGKTGSLSQFAELFEGIAVSGQASLETHWSDDSGHTYVHQNDYNDIIESTTIHSNLFTHRDIKSLIAQESSFMNYDRRGSFTGLMQMNHDAAVEAGITDAERMVPAKAIQAGIKVLENKQRDIDTYLRSQDIFSKYSNEDRRMLTIAAYNAGQGRITKAMSQAITDGISAPKFDDLIRGGEKSPIWRTMPSKWNAEYRLGKMNEISNYAPQILRRLRSD